MIGRGGYAKSVWSHMGEMHDTDWQAMVEAAAFAAEELVPQLPEDLAVEALIARVRPADPALADRLDDGAANLTARVFADAAVIGFALARTWPARIEDLEQWPRRALAYGGLAIAAAAATSTDDETFAAVIAPTGFDATDEGERTVLLTSGLWEQTVEHRTFEAEKERAAQAGDVRRLDELHTGHYVAATAYAALAAAELVRTEGLPDAERIRRMKAAAGRIDAARAPVAVLEQLADWLAAHCPAAGDTPDAALATVLSAVPGLEQLRGPAAG